MKHMTRDELIAWGEQALHDPDVDVRARVLVWRELLRLEAEVRGDADHRLQAFLAKYVGVENVE